MENGPFEDVSPIENGAFFIAMLVHQRVKGAKQKQDLPKKIGESPWKGTPSKEACLYEKFMGSLLGGSSQDGRKWLIGPWWSFSSPIPGVIPLRNGLSLHVMFFSGWSEPRIRYGPVLRSHPLCEWRLPLLVVFLGDSEKRLDCKNLLQCLPEVHGFIDGCPNHDWVVVSNMFYIHP